MACRAGRQLLGVAGLVFLATGCGASGEPDDSDRAYAVLGTGNIEFEALADGDDIAIVHGMQGGYHFFGSARMTGLIPGDGTDLTNPDNPTTTFTVTRDGQRIDANIAGYVQGYRPLPDTDLVELIPRVVVLDIEDDAELDGATVEFTVTITDVTGATASDTKSLIAVPHPDNP